MRVAMIGTRGVPARYGGFETAVEEVGRRLVERGHDVVVYCRGAEATSQRRYLGMELVHLPAARRKTLETLSHTGLSVADVMRHGRRPDASLLFNPANAPFLPALRLKGIPTAVHVGGLEWQRSKWAGAGRRYYRAVEAYSVRNADAIIADAQGIADYYRVEFGLPTEFLTYGAPVQERPGSSRIEQLGLEPHRYHVVVARFQPDNHVLEVVEGYHRSQAELPLVVVGSAPYADEYTRQIGSVADSDPRITLLGGVWDQALLDELYANALTYLHGHSCGGTNPSLLRAMGAGTSVIAYDVVFNREVLGPEGTFFRSSDELSVQIRQAELSTEQMISTGASHRGRVRAVYRWDDVAAGYENLLLKLRDGHSTRGLASGRRHRAPDGRSAWTVFLEEGERARGRSEAPGPTVTEAKRTSRRSAAIGSLVDWLS